MERVDRDVHLPVFALRFLVVPADFLAVDLRVVDFLAVDFFAGDLLAVDFFAVLFFAVLFLAVDFLAGLLFFAVDFLAVDFLAGLDFLAVDFFAGLLRAAELFALLLGRCGDAMCTYSVSVSVVRGGRMLRGEEPGQVVCPGSPVG